jgi:hypothetical protein
MKKTDWFPRDVRPARVGVYETLDRRFSGRDDIRFQHWNGKFWGAYAATQVIAEDSASVRSNCRAPKWRGLASPAK